MQGQIPLTGVAASARVGNFIGARDATSAKRASHASALLSVVAGAIVMTVLMATKDVSPERRYDVLHYADYIRPSSCV